jgi:hypothetical protein
MSTQEPSTAQRLERAFIEAFTYALTAAREQATDSESSAQVLALAHRVCAEAYIPAGDIAWRLEVLKGLIAADKCERDADAAAEQPMFPERDRTKPAEAQGIFRKFVVKRTDGSDGPGGKHAGCEYFVLDITHDRHAPAALTAYAQSAMDTHPALAKDLVSRYNLPTQAAPAPVALQGVPDKVSLPLARLLSGQDFFGMSPNDVDVYMQRAQARWDEIRAVLPACPAAQDTQ